MDALLWAGYFLIGIVAIILAIFFGFFALCLLPGIALIYGGFKLGGILGGVLLLFGVALCIYGFVLFVSNANL